MKVGARAASARVALKGWPMRAWKLEATCWASSAHMHDDESEVERGPRDGAARAAWKSERKKREYMIGCGWKMDGKRKGPAGFESARMGVSEMI